MQSAIDGLGHDVQRVESLEEQDEGDRDRAQAECHRRTGEQHG